MFTPHSLGIALFMMITSAICWGSWANTYKGVKNYRFELFYWDYADGVVPVKQFEAIILDALVGVGPGAPANGAGDHHEQCDTQTVGCEHRFSLNSASE